MAINDFWQASVQFEGGSEDRDRLQMGGAVNSLLHCGKMSAHVFDKIRQSVGGAAGPGGMQFIPEVPCKERTVAAPSFRGEGKALLDGAARILAQQKFATVVTRSSISF